ncbi:MAG: ribosome biogenesis GTPase YlqF [Acholeplasmatales bacterium]
MENKSWYPGHMAKALREIKGLISKVDIIYLLLDSRAPESSLNPIILDVIKDKPVLYLYNKSTLADLDALRKTIKEENYLIIDALHRKNTRNIPKKTNEMLADLIAKKRSQGYLNYPIKAMILGIPNVGKSTLVNALANRKSTSTDYKPGYTKILNWIKISGNINLLDTPGLLWPKIEDVRVKYHLSLAGSIKEELLNKEALFNYGYDYLMRYYPNYLTFYKVSYETKEIFLRSLMEYRGLTKEEVYSLFLNDIKDGLLGGICFDL